MKIIENNLKQFIDIPSNIAELTNSFITEVESFGPLTNINNLVIGHVLEKEKHPDADTLNILKVDLGNDYIEQIVCGAPNVDKGQYVIVAKIGAILPGDFVIKKSKIRGIESNGMVCSLQELGIDEKLIPEAFKKGIYYFEEVKEVGSNALTHLSLDGFTMELSLTPNRADLLSHYGYANDLAAVLGKKITLPSITIKEDSKKNDLSVVIESNNTNSYYARLFSNLEVKDSPWWIKSFLLAMGCQPINNVVDITNYILYTYGIPMHAFDAKKFGTKTIVIKDNKEKQNIVTLDGKTYTITNDEILITNGTNAMALGGVMGLENSMITNDSTDVILEVASFNAKTINEVSKKLNLKSDSSLRFERGIDEAVMQQALQHATSLLIEYANATVLSGIASDTRVTVTNPKIEIDPISIAKYMGNDISKEAIIDILERLNYTIEDNKKLVVTAPTYRHDIYEDHDVLEEVVRLYGMDQVENKPLLVTGLGQLTNKQVINRRLRHYLANIGFNEVVTYGMLKEENVKKYNDLGDILSVLKPLTIDRKSMRQSLLNGLEDVVKYNRARNYNNINIFEIGHVYAKDVEHNYLSVALSSPLQSTLWKKETDKIDFYYLSGILNNIMSILNVDYELVVSNNEALHPYQQASILIKGQKVGIIGLVHPKQMLKPVYVFELDLDLINNPNKFKYTTISKFPNVERDIAVVLDNTVEVKEVLRLINQTAKKQLVDLRVFDIYTGDHVGENQKSVAVRMTFNDPNKTLEGSDVDKLVNKIVKRIEFELGGTIRS